MHLGNIVLGNKKKHVTTKKQKDDFKAKANETHKLPRPNQHTCKIVHDLLQNRFIKLFNAAKIDRSKYYDVLKTVTSNSLFAGIDTYHNLPMAEAVLNEVVGLGVVSEIARDHQDKHGDTTVTDIVFNGYDLWYQTNNKKIKYGTQPGEDASILTDDYINQLINKFANNAENDESINQTSPIFNGMYKNMRLSVCYGGRKGLTPLGSKSTFAVRISQAKLPLNEHNFSSFAPLFVYTKVLSPMIKGRASFMISGETGSAKTSLLKLMTKLIPEQDRIVMIEDTPETHLHQIYPKKDILNWITSKTSHTQISDLVAESLRVDPKWVDVGEVRDGLSAYQMFQSVKTGHSLMTTLHAKDNATVPSRFAGMIRESMTSDPNALIDGFLDYFDIGIHNSSKEIGGHIFRYMDELSEFVPKSKKHPRGINTLFRQEVINVHGVAYRKWWTYHTSQKIKDTVKRNYDINNFDMPYVDDYKVKKDGNGKVILNKNKQPILLKDKNGQPIKNDHFAKVPLNDN